MRIPVVTDLYSEKGRIVAEIFMRKCRSVRDGTCEYQFYNKNL